MCLHIKHMHAIIYVSDLSMRSENFMTVPRLQAKTTPRDNKLSGWSQSDLMLKPPQIIIFSYKRQKQVSLQQINRSRYCWRQPNKKDLSIKGGKPVNLILIQETGHYHLRSVSERSDTLSAFTALLLYGLKQLYGPIRPTARLWD